jgi:hypothetical protein
VTNIGDLEDPTQAGLSENSRRKISRTRGTTNRAIGPLRLALCMAASLSLVGCSLAMPDDGELFASPAMNTDGGPQDRDASQLDSSMDGAVLDEAGSQPNIDGGLVADAASDASPSDAADDAVVDATQDAAPPAFNASAGLVVHYRFNETTGNTVNDFAGDKDAVIVGTPTGFEQWVAAGQIGGALRLAGVTPDGGVGHYVELPQGALLGLQQCSISLWVNRAGGAMWQRVIDFGSGPPVWLYFTPHGGTGLPIIAGRTPALIFVDYIAIPEADAGVGQLKINQPIPVSTWVHFVLTWSASEMKVYLNGKLVAQATPNGQVAPTDLGNTGQNYLGRSQFAADPYFNGMLDEFRIYDRVLSASDVSQLYELR